MMRISRNDDLDHDMYDDPEMMMEPMGMPSATAGGDKKGGGNGNSCDKKGGDGNEIPVRI